MGRARWSTFAVVVIASCHDPAARAPMRDPVAFDADLLAPLVAPQLPALPGAVTAIDPQRGTARFVWLHDDVPRSPVASGADRRRGASSLPAIAALHQVERDAARWGLDQPALDGLEVAHVHDLGRGAIVVKLRQRIGGVEVAHTSLSIVLDRNLAITALSGGLHPAGSVAPAFRIGARDAIGRAFTDAGTAQRTLTPIGDRAGYQRFEGDALVAPARTKQVLYPVGTTLVPAWTIELGLRDGDAIRGVRQVIAADDGRVLARESLTADAFAYRVWADAAGDRRPLDGPQGDVTPHPTGMPDGFAPAFVAPALVTIDGLDATSDPWLPAGATTTSGNNVDAYADVDGINGSSAGDIRPALTSPGAFDRTFDVQTDPLAVPSQAMAAVTEMFYVTNWLHDYWYDSGFTEAAGNAQVSNFGRGGIEGDVLDAEGEDASDVNNANMFTPGDGASPVMQMFVFDAPTGGVRRDGTIDNHVIEHEWGHYLHHRLTDCATQQCSGMSEGWSDFNALLTSVRAGDDLHGTFALAGYVMRVFTVNSAYFGIRRYPYSIDLTRNPLTLKYVQNGVALPAGVPRSDISFLQNTANFEVHSAGEVWCAMLWEGLVAMLRDSTGPTPRFTFEQARRRMADYVVGGMIAAPAQPTLIEQRDAILAVAAASDPQDFVLLAQAFARRGFGSGAVAPPSGSSNGSGVVESFAVTGMLDLVAATLTEDAGACDDDGIVDVGETGTLTITVRNPGAAALTAPTVTVSSTSPGVVFPAGTSVALPAIASFAQRTVTIPLRLDEAPTQPSTIDVQVALADPGAALSPVVRTVTAAVNLDTTPAASTRDDFEALALAWTASPGWSRVALAPTNHVAEVAVAVSGDHTLTSPPLQVGSAGPLTISWKHRHVFALSLAGAPLDGGVLEITTDGVTWHDVTSIANPQYTGVVAGTGNPLVTRSAWGGASTSYPDFDAFSLDLGTGFAGTAVQLRFRAGGDDRPGPSRWDVDDVAIGGITNLPFPSTTPETGSCLPGARPIASAGVSRAVNAGELVTLDGTGSTDPDGGALTYAWTQRSGALVTLSDATSAQPRFTAPTSVTTQQLVFELVVRDPDQRVSAPASVTFTIPGVPLPDGAPDAPLDAGGDAAFPDAPGAELVGGGGGCGCGTGREPGTGGVLGLAVAWVLRRRRARR